MLNKSVTISKSATLPTISPIKSITGNVSMPACLTILPEPSSSVRPEPSNSAPAYLTVLPSPPMPTTIDYLTIAPPLDESLVPTSVMTSLDFLPIPIHTAPSPPHSAPLPTYSDDDLEESVLPYIIIPSAYPPVETKPPAYPSDPAVLPISSPRKLSDMAAPLFNDAFIIPLNPC